MTAAAAAATPRAVEPMSGRALVALALAGTLMPLGSTMVAVAVPAIAADLGVDAARTAQALVTPYLLGAIVGQWPGGRIGDRLGLARTVRIGLIATACGALLAALGAHLAVLAAGRVLMAAGGALMIPAGMAMLRSRVAPERRAHAYGIAGAIMTSAAAVGPTLGGELTAHFGWRAVFLANLPVVLAAFLLGLRAPASGARPAASATAGGPGTGRWHALRALLSDRIFLAGALVIALQNLAMYALLHQVPLILAGLAVGPAGTGRTMLLFMAAMVLASPVGGRASARWGARAVGIAGSLIAVLAYVALTRVASFDSPLDLVPGLLAAGLGIGLCTAPANASAMGAARDDAAGEAGGVLSTLRYVGGIGGIQLLSLTVAHASAADAPGRHALVLWCLASVLVASALVATRLPGRATPPRGA